jgi:hypothetical protein
MCEVDSRPRRGVLDTTFCDELSDRYLIMGAPVLYNNGRNIFIFPIYLIDKYMHMYNTEI